MKTDDVIPDALEEIKEEIEETYNEAMQELSQIEQHKKQIVREHAEVLEKQRIKKLEQELQ